MARAPGKRALIFILITIMIDAMGLGVIIPVMPKLIMTLTGEDISRAVIYGGWLLFLYAIMQFFFAPIMGNLSDRFGRRPVILLSLLAFGFDYILMGIAPTIGWLFFGRIIAGIAGATFTPANAYIADVSPPAQRARNFGFVGAAWGLGFILGPVIGGYLGEYGARIPFYAAGGLALVNFVYGFIVLPETVTQENRRPFSLKRANPVGTLRQMTHYPIVVGLLVALFFYQIAHDANPSIWSYFTVERFDWTPRDIGRSIAAVGVMVMIVQGGLVGVVVPRLGEPRAIALGLTFGALGFIGFAFATEGWMMYALIIPWSLMGLATPAIRSLMANAVPDDAQGELQGAITSLFSLTAVGAPLLMTRMFGYFAGETAPIYFPGAPFLLAGVLLICAMMTAMITVQRGMKNSAV